MKKKILIVISIIIIIFVVALLVIQSSNDATNKEKPEKKDKKCIDIETKIENNETFALFITEDLSVEGDQSDIINKYLRNYKTDNNIYIIDKLDMDKNCIKKIVKEAGVYDVASDTQVSSVLGYLKGKMIGSIHNLTSYETLEDFLNENKIITKKTIKDNLSLNEFKNKTKQNKYMLLILIDEEKRIFFTKNLEEVFSDYNYDTINRKSKEGQQIDKFMKKEYKEYNEYPRLFYFENGKLIKDDEVYSLESFEEFKSNINK